MENEKKVGGGGEELGLDGEGEEIWWRKSKKILEEEKEIDEKEAEF